MSIRPIRVFGDPILRRRAEPVREFSRAAVDELRRLTDDMFETMYAAKGIGIAAPQVGVSERVFVTDVEGARHVLINPELVATSGPTEPGEEGCLSIPEILGDVKRPATVLMNAFNLEGEPVSLEATGMLARCMQHEFDHLEGRLFIDHLSFLKRRRALSEWAKMEPDFPGYIRILTPGDPGDSDRGHPNEEL